MSERIRQRRTCALLLGLLAWSGWLMHPPHLYRPSSCGEGACTHATVVAPGDAEAFLLAPGAHVCGLCAATIGAHPTAAGPCGVMLPAPDTPVPTGARCERPHRTAEHAPPAAPRAPPHR